MVFNKDEEGLFGDSSGVGHAITSGQSKVFGGRGGSSATNLVEVVDEMDIIGDGDLVKEC